MQVTIHAAKTHLSRLIEAALAGEEVIIARGKVPVVKIVAIPKSRFKVGILEGRVAGDGRDSSNHSLGVVGAPRRSGRFSPNATQTAPTEGVHK